MLLLLLVQGEGGGGVLITPAGRIAFSLAETRLSVVSAENRGASSEAEPSRVATVTGVESRTVTSAVENRSASSEAEI